MKTLTSIPAHFDEYDVKEETTFGLWAEPFVVQAKHRGNASRSFVRVTTGEGRVREYGMDKTVKGQIRFRQWDGMGEWVVSSQVFKIWTNKAPPVVDRVSTTRRAGTNWMNNGMLVLSATGADPQYGWQVPVATQIVVRTPSGLSRVVQVGRTTQGADLAVQVSINGATYATVYTATNRQVTATTPEGRVAWAWLDGSGRVARVQEPGLYPVSMSYDGQGRAIRVEQGTGDVARVVQWGYSSRGYLSSLTNGLGEMVQVGSDALGRTTNVVSPDERRIGLRYDRSEQPVGVTPPGRGEHGLSYTPVGNPVGYGPPMVESGSGGLAWTYNQDRQLTGVIRPDGGVITNYDANGNRTQAVVRGNTSIGMVDGQDRLLGYGGMSYQYGTTGTLTNKVDGSGQVTAYRYDARGVLLGVTRFDGQVLEYRVDALGRRIGKRLPTGEERRWIYANGLKPVAELDGSNRVVSVFVYGTGGLTPDYIIRDGIKYKLVADHIGSPRLVVNARTGEIVQRLDYDEWGRVTRDTNPGFQPFGFAGGLYDHDTGLVRFGVRDYDPETGRWTARDPILFAGGQANLYVYCNNNPVNYIDPDGLYVQVVIGGVVGGVAGAIAGGITGEGVWRGLISGAVGGVVFGATFNPALGAAAATGMSTIGAGIAAGTAAGAASGLASGIIQESFDAAKKYDTFSFTDLGASTVIGGMTGGALGPIGSMNQAAIDAGAIGLSKSTIAEQLLNFDVNLIQGLAPNFIK